MAAEFYAHVTYLLATQQINLATDPFKVILLGEAAGGGYAFDGTQQHVDPGSGGAASVSGNELTATNYGSGFGGTGRLTASRTTVEDAANSRTRLVFSNLTWPSLGGALNDTIDAAVVVKEGTSDTDSLLIAYWPLSSTTTTGKDFVLVMDSVNGNMQILS